MSEVQEIQQLLDETKTAVAQLQQAVARRPESWSLRVNLQALQKRQRVLEQRLRQHEEAALTGAASLEAPPRPND